MEDSRFWALVASTGPELAAARLEMVLRALPRAGLDDFCVCLSRVQDAIDTVDHRSSSSSAVETARGRFGPRAWWAPEKARPAVLSELQLTIVAHGRDAWQAVAAVPMLMGGSWPTGLGRQFLAAVTAARAGAAPATAAHRPV